MGQGLQGWKIFKTSVSLPYMCNFGNLQTYSNFVCLLQGKLYEDLVIKLNM